MTTGLTTILGYSAMSGVIGGGGLGKVAISYGYYRYQTDIMLICVVLLVLLVQLFQSAGTLWANKSDKRLREIKPPRLFLGERRRNDMERDTICVQGGYTPGNGEPRQIPIIQSTTFKYATSEDMGKLFDLEAEGYFYSRLQNPTCDYVAKKTL